MLILANVLAGGKNGEYYVPSTNTWTKAPNSLVANMLTADAREYFVLLYNSKMSGRRTLGMD
jgi:hypothetical protein